VFSLGSINQNFGFSPSVFLCEFFFASPLFCEDGGICEAYRGFGCALREESAVEMDKVSGG
jgi:hypothetical protein